MVFIILHSDEEFIIRLTDLHWQYLLLPSFDFQQSIMKSIYEKYPLSLWIQIICLNEITNQEIIDQFLYEDSTSLVDIINQALESENFLNILNCRCLIRELYSQMYKEWHLQYCIIDMENSSEIATNLVAYYIDNTSIDQLRLFEGYIGKKLIINKFLLLNENIDVALNNINSTSKVKSILFEININTKLVTKPYVRILNQQILIAPCAIYFIESIIYNSQINHWQIKLNLCSQDDSDIYDYLQVLPKTDYITDTYIYGWTLYLFEEYQLVIDFLFDQLKVYPNIDYGYVGLLQLLGDALLYTSIDNTSSSLFIISLILKTCKLLHNVNIIDRILASVYLTLGNIFRRQNLFTKALFYYEKSKNKMKSDDAFGNYGMHIFLNISYIQEMMHKYINALNRYQAFSKYLTECLYIPKTNLIFKKHAKNIGRIQCKLFFNQLKRIEIRYEQNAFAIFCLPDLSLLPNLNKITKYREIPYRNLLELLVKHYYRSTVFDSRIVAALYTAISNEYIQNGKIQSAINSRKMAINIRLKNLSFTTNLLLMDYYSIAVYYYICHMNGKHNIGIDKRYLKYADYYIKKTMQMQKNILSCDHIFLAESYNVQAVIYFDYQKYNLALIYFTQTLKIYLTWITDDHGRISLLYKSIGIVYLHKKNYVKAIEYFQRALINVNNIAYSSDRNLIQIYKLLTLAYYHLHDTDKAFEQMKTLISVYREKMLDKNDPTTEFLEYSIENNPQITFHQLYQQTAGLIHPNYHQTLRLLKFDFESLFLSACHIYIPLYICVYDEYLFKSDVYFLSLNDTNEDIALVNRIRNYSQANYFICYKVFSTITELCQYIQLISEEDGEKIRSIALIIPTRLFDIIQHQIPIQKNLKIFNIDENFITDIDLQQLVNMIDKWLKIQFGEFKQFIQCEDFADINTDQNTIKDHGDSMKNTEESVMQDLNVVVSTAQTTDSSSISSIEEELKIIWFCENIEEANNSRLFQAFDSIHLINNSVECIQLISSMDSNQKLFLILTDEYGLNLLEAVKSKCMHIYFVNIHHYQSKDSTINHKIFETFDQLTRQLRIDIRMTCEDRLQFNFFTSTAKSIQQLDKESAEFIWFHALINAMQHNKLEQMKITKWYKIEKNVLLNKCRLDSNMNQTTVKKINLFEETYRENDAIKWYAEDTFIYRLINKALRTNNVEEIIQYRFFIADLHYQLKLLCEEQFSDMNTVTTVYRGQGISKKELNLLKNNTGNLITIKSFLSTSWDKDVALNFVITQIDVPNVEPVLFEIKLDTNFRQNPFAYISEFTPMNEAEVLLSMGFVFRIELVKFDQTGKFWIVELISEPETDQIKELLKHTIENVSSGDLGRVLYGMGEYTAALRYAQWYIGNFDDDDIVSAVNYIQMATMYKELGEHENALDCIRKSAPMIFERGQYGTAFNKYYLISLYYPLGLIYLGRQQYHNAIYIFQATLQQWKEFSKEMQLVTKDLASQEGWEWLSTWEGDPNPIARTYNNLGFAYMLLKQYRAAYHYLSKGVELQLKFLPKNHYYLAVSYCNLGNFYKRLMDYQNALEYYRKALEILKLSRQAKHHSVLNAYEQTAGIYEIKYDYPMALENYQNAFNHATSVIEIINQLMNIARIYNKMKQYKQAIEASERAARLCREHSLSMSLLLAKNDNIMLFKVTDEQYQR